MGKLRPARTNDPSGRKHMDEIGLHHVEQTLVMGDQQHRLVGLAHDPVDAFADHAQRVDIEAAVGFIENRELRVERSEEHTSELQSLMRISYAVFCLKKKKKALLPLTISHIEIDLALLKQSYTIQNI